MSDADIALFLQMNEPMFEVGGKQYSVCVPSEEYATWDSNGNMFEFTNIEDLLDNWVIDGKPFCEIISSIM